MNRFKAISSALLFVPALALVSTQARAEFKCDAPSTNVDRTACEKAKESPTALRHYIQRIQMIHSLQFSDYVSDAQTRAWAESASKRVPVRKASVQAATLPENHGA